MLGPGRPTGAPVGSSAARTIVRVAPAAEAALRDRGDGGIPPDAADFRLAVCKLTTLRVGSNASREVFSVLSVVSDATSMSLTRRVLPLICRGDDDSAGKITGSLTI